MPKLADFSDADLRALDEKTTRDYAAFGARGLKLDMTRGKPSSAQLDLANAMLALPGNGDHFTQAHEDARNYGGLQGLAEARALFSSLMGAPPAQIVIGDNASLAMMHDCIAWALLKGVPGSQQPWRKEEAPVFLCPAPGYDRHFAICEAFDIGMIPIALTGHGPDMDQVEKLVRDPAVKGMWAIPKYSNPTGDVYSGETVRRLAAMECGAPDFRLFWDNAYVAHHLSGQRIEIANILEACASAGHADRAFVFSSTSKVTFAGAGLALLASSPANIAWYLERAGKRTIGPDKLNQLRHVRFLRDHAGIEEHMDKQRAILAPKFAAVESALAARLADIDDIVWTKPLGGYFVSVDARARTAQRVVALARDVGLALTPAGATWPQGKDPNDSNLRISPSYPPLEDVRIAAEGIAICLLKAAVESEVLARKPA